MATENESFEKELYELNQQEDMAKKLADDIQLNFGLDRAVSISVARWSLMWLEDYKKRVKEFKASKRMGNEALNRVSSESRIDSMDRVEGLPRYTVPSNNGAVRIEAIVAAEETFKNIVPEELKP